MKCCVYLKTSQPLFSLNFFFSPSPQYFETDDQEFYKTKVCFILNNDVSEMDLVFAEEKYSKSGQLEKVRRRLQKKKFNYDERLSLRPAEAIKIHFIWIITVPLKAGETLSVQTFATVCCKFSCKLKDMLF